MDKASENALHALGNQIKQEQDRNLVAWDDTTTAGVTYLQFCKPGNNGNANGEISSIQAINENTGSIGYPNGDSGFTFIWANRAGYTYKPL